MVDELNKLVLSAFKD